MGKLINHELLGIEQKCSLLVKQAGSLLTKGFEVSQEIEYKDLRDMVSKLDIKVESFLREGLSNILPNSGFIVEEGENKQSGDYTWMIDPIDGTKNFVARAPFFYTQFALLYKNNPILSEIYQPISNQLFSAISGNGAFLNHIKIEANTRTKPEESIIDLDFRGIEDLDLKLKIFNELPKYFYRVRSSGGMFSPYLVTGAFDGYLDLFRTSKYFDIIPRILLFKEAGLQAKYIEVKENKKIFICAKQDLFGFIENKIKQIFK